MPKVSLGKYWSKDGALGITPYPERADRKVFALDRHIIAFAGGIRARLTPRRVLAKDFIRKVEVASDGITGLDDMALKSRAEMLRPELLREGFVEPLLVEAFACLREATRRELGFPHRANQIYGALLMLKGSLLEMATGEGKTVTALLAAGVAALAGRRVHVVTVNDYLAKRDCEELGPIYSRLNISIGLVLEEDEPPARAQAYNADVVYVNNKSVTFDYLRDRVGLSGHRSRSQNRVASTFGKPGIMKAQSALTMKGLDFVIVDEADSVLIDEAKTPLILSAEVPAAETPQEFIDGLEVARQLQPEIHFRLHARARLIELTEAGRTEIATLLFGKTGLWAVRRAREARLEQALSALHVFHLNEQYIIKDGKILLVDEFTGRVMPDRSWEGGLQQMVEAKEGLEQTNGRRTIARLTYQRFFRRYRHVCGMSGTAMEVSGEILAEYDMRVRPVPTHRPPRRKLLSPTLLASSEKRWEVVAGKVEALQRLGRPVLIGVRSVAAAEALSEVMTRRHIAHHVLSAKQDAEEAELIARAGHRGMVTVATNMAGRGTDIKLGEGVREAGGLHVILTEYHESIRIDRQLYGRAGRQGDPGSAEAIVSLDDDLFQRYARLSVRLLRPFCARFGITQLPVALTYLLRRSMQTQAEWENSSIRYNNFKQEKEFEQGLGFVGDLE